MANSVSSLNKEQYTKTVQSLLEERLIAMDICNIRKLESGTTLNNPRGVYMNVDSYTKYTDVTDQDVTYTNETLTINQTPIISFVYDAVDRLDNSYDAVAIEAPKAAYRIKQDIEGNLFNEYSNAGSAAAATVTLSTSNVVSTYGDGYATLTNAGVDSDNIVAVVDPFQLNMIGQGALGNTFNVADESYRRGYKGEFQNMRLYVSTNLTASYTLDLATNPTADDTITINGVVLTAKAVPSAAGEFDIGASADATAANIILAINGTGTPGATTYIEVSASDRAKLEGITATDGTDLITIESKRGYKVVSTSMTAAANDFQAVVIHNILMEKGAIDFAMQKEVSLKTQDVHKQLATRYMTWTRYGIKTFTQGAERMYDLPIQSQAAEA